VDGIQPDLLVDAAGENYYKASKTKTTFDDLFDYTGASLKTMVDSDGVLKWAPHNLLRYSGDITVTLGSASAWQYINTTATGDALEETSATGEHGIKGASFPIILPSGSICTATFKAKARERFKVGVTYPTTGEGAVAFDLSTGELLGPLVGSAISASITPDEDGWYICSMTYSRPGANVVSNNFHILNDDATSINSRSYAGTEGSGLLIKDVHVYRSDLGGMVNNPDTGSSYVPTTGSAVYLPRRGHHIWDGSAWVNEGLLIESEARTNRLLNSGTLATQDVTVTTVTHTLNFTGTGTVTLSGASTAGPLVGTGTGEDNRASLTFTPTAGTLTLTVSGTVTNAQLEVGATPSSYIPTAGASATRAAETIPIPSANLPYNATAMWVTLTGLETYADEDVASQVMLMDWRSDVNNRITLTLDTDGAKTGAVKLTVVSGGTSWSVSRAGLSPGVNEPFNVAFRVTDSDINIAVNGTAATAVAITSIPNLSAASIDTAGMGTRSLLRVGNGVLTDPELVGATS